MKKEERMALSASGGVSGTSGGSSATKATSSPRRLLVPAADVLAKNRRAAEQGVLGSPTNQDSNSLSSTSFLMGLGVNSESVASKHKKHEQQNHQARFQSASALFSAEAAASNKSLSPFKYILSKFSKSKSKSKKDGNNEVKKPSKLLRTLEKASNLISDKLPNPILELLLFCLLVLFLKKYKQKLMQIVYTKIILIFALFIPLLHSIIYKKSELYKLLQDDSQYVITHSTDHKYDVSEMELSKREEDVQNALETLSKNEDKLDMLKKELNKLGNLKNLDGQIIPSRKAAEMIVAGALGAGIDAETAQQVEQRRKEENMKRSRDEWKSRVDNIGIEDEFEVKENLKILANHAALPYDKRTKDIKNRSNPNNGNYNGGKAAEKFNQFRKNVQNATALKALDKSRRVSRHSERSVPVTTRRGRSRISAISGKTDGEGGRESVGSRRRFSNVFGRGRRRDTAPELDSRLTMSESGGNVHSSRR